MFEVSNTASLLKTNDAINNLFNSKKSFSVIRVGNTEGYVLQCISKNEMPVDQFVSFLFYTAGVFPVDEEFLFNGYAPYNFKAMHNADLLGFIDISGEIRQDQTFVDSFKNDKFFFEDIYALDPGFLKSNNFLNVRTHSPWTLNLKGKRVLVISAFKESILRQWDKRKQIWGSDADILVPFELVDVIKSPFNPMIDNKLYLQNDLYSNITSWIDALNTMTYLMDKYQYDVVLISAAAYSPALANYAKLKNKIGITVCGALQLFFGIKGPRWEQGSLTEWSTMYNDHWEYPLETDLPSHRQIFEQIESAYWKK